MYRIEEYRSAGLSVLPVKRGARVTKIWMLCYITAFMAGVTALSVLGYAGQIFLAVMGALGLAWLLLGLHGLTAKDDAAWARQMYGFSLAVVVSLSIMLAVGSTLP